MFIGVFTTTLQNPKLHKNHYLNLISQHSEAPENIIFSIQEVLKPSLFHTKYIINIESINKKPARGLCLLNLPKDSTKNHSSSRSIIFWPIPI